MVKLRRGRAKRLIMDIGSSAVRLCELSQTKTGYQLTKYFHREFNIDPSVDEEQQRQMRQETIKALLKEAKVRQKKTLFGVPGQSVFTRTRALPPVPEYKVTQIVRYEIQQQIPFPLDQIAFDYQVLQRTEAGGYDVLMAAIKVEVVEKRLEVIKDIKKQIDTVDVCPLAAYNWLKTTGEFGDTGECVALIDLGAATTDIVIERDNLFRFTRSLNLGGNDITSAIAAEFNATFADAEKIKRERGFAPTGDAQRDGRGGEVIGRVLNRLVSEITRSFAYFRSQPGGGPVNRIIVTGGGSCLRNIIPFLQRQLGAEVRIAQPLAGLAIGPGAQEVNEHPEQAAVALGLALRCCQNVPIAINLIPPRITEAVRRREQIFYWALSIATLGLIMASIIPKTAQDNKAVKDEIELLTNNISFYDQKIRIVTTDATKNPSTWTSQFENDFAAKKGEIGQLIGKQELLDLAYLARTPWLDYLVWINDARPKGKLIVISTFESSQLGPPGSATTTSSSSSDRGTGMLRGFGGPQSALSAQGGAPATISSPGFRGISPAGGAGGTTSFGTGGFGRRSERGLGSAAAAPAVTVSGEPGLYNGVIIRGFAGDIDSLLTFVDNLRNSKKFVKVFFEDRFTDPVPVTNMDKAAVVDTTRQVQANAGLAGADRHDRDRGGFGRGLGLGANTGYQGLGQPSQQFHAAWDQAGTVLTFRIDIQTAGVPADEQKAAPTTASPGFGNLPASPLRAAAQGQRPAAAPAAGSERAPQATPTDRNSLADIGQ